MKKRRLWTCDQCGKRETWCKGWGYFDGIESPKNCDDGLIRPVAFCSDACSDAWLDAFLAQDRAR